LLLQSSFVLNAALICNKKGHPSCCSSSSSTSNGRPRSFCKWASWVCAVDHDVRSLLPAFATLHSKLEKTKIGTRKLGRDHAELVRVWTTMFQLFALGEKIKTQNKILMYYCISRSEEN
jgi:hypothetical protein